MAPVRLNIVPEVLMPARRTFAISLVLSCLLTGLWATPARPQVASCSETAGSPEPFGPTDISAVSGNGGMSVAFNRAGTVTVLRWPTPSFHDQIKYRTTDRSRPRMGALANEGAFLGIAWTNSTRGAGKWTFEWLRGWRATQRFADDDGDEIVTRYVHPDSGLRVTVRDVVSSLRDGLVRDVTVARTQLSRVRRVRVFSFANFNPVFSKDRNSHTQDWCEEEQNDDGGSYDRRRDAVVHSRSGVDASTGSPSGAALAMGFDGSSDGHHVGQDTYELGTGELSAYDDAADGRLSGADAASGQADAAMYDQLSLARRAARTTVYITAAYSSDDALSVLRVLRQTDAAPLRRAKRIWWRSWLSGSKVPRGPEVVRDLAKRALITFRQNHARDLIVRSISTQPPFALDWIRDGAFIDRALNTAGYRAMSRGHSQRYAALQATSFEKPLGGEGTPPGNWAEAYYADGVAGASKDYEIDGTGLGIWTLWDHFAFEDDRSYLNSVYEAIQLGAHYLSDNPPLGCRNPTNGLYCAAPDSNSDQPRQSLVGAQAIWLGLDAAAEAADILGTDTAKQNATKWRTRRDELRTAIRQSYLDEDCGCYTDDPQVGGINLWPVGLEPYGSKISKAQAASNWRHVARAMAGRVESGGNEALAILGNAYEWQGEPRKMRKLERALVWVARRTTTRATGLLGQGWRRFPKARSPIVVTGGQPNAWAGAAFYLAAVKVYGKTRWRP